jgi:hypothetical protein
MFMRFCQIFAIVSAVSMIFVSPQMTIANYTVPQEAGSSQDSILDDHSRIHVFQAAGLNRESIQSNVDAFRDELGAPDNGNAPGPLLSGRREINWDGGGATTAAPAGTPFAGFLNIRGALFTTPGTGFLQTPLDAPELRDINRTYRRIFTTFSPQRIFVPIGDNIVDVLFFVPGTATPGPPTPATVSGFGAVFTDVDRSDSTKIEYFSRSGRLLFASNVAASPGRQTLSFLGVAFDDRRIFRVRITSGNTPLGPDDRPFGLIGQSDIVAMDDFIYSEPRPIHGGPNTAEDDDHPE